MGQVVPLRLGADGSGDGRGGTVSGGAADAAADAAGFFSESVGEALSRRSQVGIGYHFSLHVISQSKHGLIDDSQSM